CRARRVTAAGGGHAPSGGWERRWVHPAAAGRGARWPPSDGMSPKSFLLSPELHDYLLAHSSPLDDVQRELIAETAALGSVSAMQVAPEQGAFLTTLTASLGVRRAVEVGTFTGYSSLCIARGLAEGGELLCCDISAEWTAIAQRAWQRAGVADRIT